jgi:tRNA/rRNA methyltransferase
MMSLDNIRVVLVSPLYGGNAGSVCRAMMNMGLSDLVIAAPRDDFDENDARKWAYRAQVIWENHREFPTLADAVADCGLVAGTSVREGLYRSHARTPREWAPMLVEEAQRGKVALVFGPEDNGLSIDDLTLCTQIIQIPSSKDYASLNLSHAVMVCAYELYVASGLFAGLQERSPEAPVAMRERMYSMWEDALLKIGFMEPHKAGHMMLGVRRILSRDQLTETDVRILMGMARQMLWYVQSHPDSDETLSASEPARSDLPTE